MQSLSPKRIQRWVVTFFSAPRRPGLRQLRPQPTGWDRVMPGLLWPPSTHEAHSALEPQGGGGQESFLSLPSRWTCHPSRGATPRLAWQSLFRVEDAGTPSQKVGPLCCLGLGQ